jgi:hypothetical protein
MEDKMSIKLPSPEYTEYMFELAKHLIVNYNKIDLEDYTKKEMINVLNNHYNYLMQRYIQKTKEFYDIKTTTDIEFICAMIKDVRQVILTSNSVAEKEKGFKLLNELYQKLDDYEKKYGYISVVADAQKKLRFNKEELISKLFYNYQEFKEEEKQAQKKQIEKINKS